MLTVDDVAVLLTKPLDDHMIAAVLGIYGHRVPSDYEPEHPEDERHYYVVPSVGLQLLAGPDGTIRTLFFMLEGDEGIATYPWSLRSGIGGASRQADVQAQLGQPEASGPESQIGSLPPLGPWDRFRYPPFGFLHIHYRRTGDGISQMTLMTEQAAPRRG